MIDDPPRSHSKVFRALLREKEVKISNTSGRIRDMMLSLHVLARHNSNIGGSLLILHHNNAERTFCYENPKEWCLQDTAARPQGR